jgi:LCP family protein required for cell wall assembly
MTSSFQLGAPSPRPPRPKTGKVAVALTLVYAIGVLVLAVTGGFRLHDWARQRIVQLSVLTMVAESAAAPAVGETPQAGQLEQPGVAAATPVPAVVAASTVVEPINVLLLGTDERPDEFGPSRTDTMIVLSVNPNTGALGMISLPRDLWVPIPGQGITTKINTAYMLGELNNYPGGGPQMVKDTVSSFLGRPVDYFVQVNFDGFREIVDLIGGVDVNVAYTIHDEEYPTADYGVETFHLDAGLQHLDGETALKYARTRHTDGDYSRSRRQQDIIRAVANKILDANMLPQLLPKAPQLLMSMQTTVRTDIPVPLGLELARVVNSGSLQDIRQLVLDNQYGEETYSSEGAWILVPDRAKVRNAVNGYYTVLAAAPADVVADTHAGGSSPVRIEVLNGTQEPGAASRAAQLLEARGWQVVSVGDADRKSYSQTIVISYGAPESFVTDVSNALSLVPEDALVKGLAPSAQVDVRVVVGNDVLDTLP